MHVLGLILGVTLPLLVFREAFEVMLLPRRVRRKLRLVRYLFSSTWFVWAWVADRMKAGPARLFDGLADCTLRQLSHNGGPPPILLVKVQMVVTV